MAVNVSTNYRTVVYSGETIYDCDLKIDNVSVSPEQIESIKISDPIIDQNDKMFHIGTFISKQITVQFFNLDGLNIYSGAEVDLSISLMVNGAPESVKIGKFLIDELAENYTEKCEITCLDYAVKFKTNVDIEKALHYEYTETTDTIYVEGKTYYQLIDGGYIELIAGEDYEIGEEITETLYERSSSPQISLEQLLIWLCDYYGVTLGTYPSINNNVMIGVHDNTISGKNYISYIAEMFGGNAKMGRDGELNIISLNTPSTITIDASQSKSWKLGEKYSLMHVTYTDAVRNYTANSYQETPDTTFKENKKYYILEDDKYIELIEGQDYTVDDEIADFGDTVYDTEFGNTLFIRTDNPYINDQSQIDAIYGELAGFEVYSVENENVGDISLDAWDILSFQLDGNTYKTLNNNETTYKMSIMTKITSKISTEQQEVTTNVVGETETAKLKRVSAKVDNINGRIELLASETSQMSTKIDENSTAIDNHYQEIQEKFNGYTPAEDFLNLQNTVREEITSLYSKTEIQEIVSGNFYEYSLTTDETYQANTEYYTLQDNEYVLLIAGEDYNVGDTITGEVYNKNIVQVTKVSSEGFTFDRNGLTIEKTEAPTKGTFNEVGVSLTDTSNDENVFFAGYVDENNENFPEYQGQTVVGTANTIVKNYFVIGSKARFEDYTDEEGNQGTGCFWIGG